MPSPDQRPVGARGRLDPHLERLLHLYRTIRSKEECKPPTVEQEISQLRGIFREVLMRNVTPATAFRNPGVLADILIHPSTDISDSTGEKRLIAVHRFVQLCGAEVRANDAEAFILSLDALLPTKGNGSWHDAGPMVAGAKSRRRPRNPTLSPADLRRLVEEAFLDDSRRDIRNRAILALLCFSGLLPGEVVKLKIHQLIPGDTANPVRVKVWRKGSLVTPWITEDAMPHLNLHLANDPPTEPEECVFTKGRSNPKPLTTKAVRNIVREACVRVGLPEVTAADLRSVFAYHLRVKAYTDHEVMTALGLEKVKSVDRLLNGHRALDAQRRVHEVLPDIDGTIERGR